MSVGVGSHAFPQSQSPLLFISSFADFFFIVPFCTELFMIFSFGPSLPLFLSAAVMMFSSSPHYISKEWWLFFSIQKNTWYRRYISQTENDTVRGFHRQKKKKKREQHYTQYLDMKKKWKQPLQFDIWWTYQMMQQGTKHFFRREGLRINKRQQCKSTHNIQKTLTDAEKCIIKTKITGD